MALLLYDRHAGQGELYALDAQAHISLLKSYSGWRTSWTHIIPIYTNVQAQFIPSSLLFYDSTSGTAQFYAIDSQGNITPSSTATWAAGWTHIVPGYFVGTDTTSLLFYNSASGLAQFYTTDGIGGIQELSSSTWSTGWTHIVSVFLQGGTALTTLLFYNQSSGTAEFYTADGNGNIHQLSSPTTWRTSWALITDIDLAN